MKNWKTGDFTKSLGGWFDDDFSGMTEYEAGVRAIEIYHEEMLKFWPNFNMSIQALLNYIHNQNKSFIVGLGMGLQLAEMDEGDVRDGMESLASASGGIVPANVQTFRAAAVDGVKNFVQSDFMHRAVEQASVIATKINVAGEKVYTIASDLAEGVESTAGLATWLTRYSKILIPAAVILIGVGYVVIIGGQAKGLLGKK